MEEDLITRKKKTKKILLILFVAWITVMVVFGVIYLSKHYRKTYTVVRDTNAPVAIVNGEPISLKTLNLAMSGMLQSGTLNDADVTNSKVQEKIRNVALDNIINQEILAQKAKEYKIVILSSQIDAEVNLIESQYENRDEFISNLKKSDITEQDLRNDIEKQLLINAFQDKVYDSSKDIVKDSDVKIFYDALREKYVKQGETPPDIDAVREKIILKILEMRHQSYLERVAKKLREKAKIEILI